MLPYHPYEARSIQRIRGVRAKGFRGLPEWCVAGPSGAYLVVRKRLASFLLALLIIPFSLPQRLVWSEEKETRNRR